MSSIRNNGSFIGTSKGDTSTAEKTPGIWKADEINNRVNDHNWAHYDQDLAVNTTYRWTPKGYRVDTSSNVQDPYRFNRFRHTVTSSNFALWIGFELRGTASSAFYKDMTIAGIQIEYTNTSGSLVYDNAFGSSWSNWATSYAGVPSTTSPNSPSYTNIGIGTTAERWNIDSGGTGSSHTGMAAGIDNTVNFDSKGVEQVSGSYYLYCETSSPTSNGDTIWIRRFLSSTSAPQPGTEMKIKIANFYNTSSTDTWNNVVKDCMLIRIGN